MLKEADVPIAPSTYYASKARQPSRRSVTDTETTTEIERVHRENYGVYGVRKVWAQVGREGGAAGRPVAPPHRGQADEKRWPARGVPRAQPAHDRPCDQSRQRGCFDADCTSRGRTAVFRRSRKTFSTISGERRGPQERKLARSLPLP